jgi:hypothetical protein
VPTASFAVKRKWALASSALLRRYSPGETPNARLKALENAKASR